jgi:tRNA(Ile)-lysidine synthase
MCIPETGTYVYDEATKFRLVTFEGQHIERDPNVCCVDASTVTFPLEIRPLCNGDRFHPLGMKGTKLVSDFLTDQHFSLIDKRRQLALCNADGSIVWLVGLRMDDRYKVTDKTISTLTITIEQQNTQI